MATSYPVERGHRRGKLRIYLGAAPGGAGLRRASHRSSPPRAPHRDRCEASPGGVRALPDTTSPSAGPLSSRSSLQASVRGRYPLGPQFPPPRGPTAWPKGPRRAGRNGAWPRPARRGQLLAPVCGGKDPSGFSRILIARCAVRAVRPGRRRTVQLSVFAVGPSRRLPCHRAAVAVGRADGPVRQ